jgi:CoA:oxalate CoA-transferase
MANASASSEDAGGADIDGPLSGVTVIDLTQVYNGPYATFLMAMAGARVIKVEPPGGEHLRRRQRDGGGQIPFAMLNSGKHCIVLDLKDPLDMTQLERLLATADVLVENFRPGVMDRLGLSKENVRKINPSLIYASSSGYGHSGAYRDYPAMDLIVQAMSGILSVTGFADAPPVKAGPAVCDMMTGIHLYAATVTALVERERTGRARAVEVAMLEATYPSFASNIGQLYGASGAYQPRTGNRHGGKSLAPYNVYRTKDGYLALVANNDEHWRRIVQYFGQQWACEDPRFKDVRSRVVNEDALDRLIESWTIAQGKEELFKGLTAAGVPCGPVRELPEVISDPHLHARKALLNIDHPDYGAVVVPTSPLCFEGLERTIRWPSRALGADQCLVDEVRRASDGA